MAGVTKEEIARAKELNLLTYFKLVEPGNLKLVGKEYRHKVHSSLTISKDSLWCWHCIGLRGRTALKYLIDVEKVPYVEAVREINRIQGGVVHSSQPVSLPQPRAEPEAPRDFKLPKPQDIFQLAQQEAVRVTASPQAWQSFLYTAAHNYHTAYLNQLLIHAQRPDAAACASMEYWNTKANRLVMRGSRSITVLQRRQGVAVTKPVFAIGDTTLLSQTHTGGPWEVTDTTRLLLLQGKPDDWLTALAQDGVSNEADRAHRMLERNVADSTLQWAQPDEQMQLLQALVTQSAVYMARLRIGLPEQDEDYPAFQSVSQFDTYQISLCLGGYLQAAAEPMLDAIGREPSFTSMGVGCWFCSTAEGQYTYWTVTFQ